MTDIYNLVNEESCLDEDIRELRSVHRLIDAETVRADGWDDLHDELDHAFRSTDQGIMYTIGLRVQVEILDRLRELNHQRYADEVALGLHKKPKRHADNADTFC